MQSQATTVEQYLADLPEDRRNSIQAVRKVILKNLDKGFEEGMLYGMIGYFVPHRLFPAGYHCDPTQPLCFAGLASQKNHMAVYLMCQYGSSGESTWFQTAWAKSGKRLDMGKSCVRFKKLEDLALDVIGEAIRRVSAKKYIASYESIRQSISQRKAAKPTKASPATKSASSKPTRKKAIAKK